MQNALSLASPATNVATGQSYPQIGYLRYLGRFPPSSEHTATRSVFPFGVDNVEANVSLYCNSAKTGITRWAFWW